VAGNSYAGEQFLHEQAIDGSGLRLINNDF